MDDEIIKKPKLNFSEYFKNNKTKFYLILTLLVVSIFGLIIFNEYKKKQNVDISEKYNKAKILIENKNAEQAFKVLEKIVYKKNRFYSPSALNLIIDNNLVKDKKKILSYFDQIIFNTTLDNETKNLFIIKRIIFIGDDIEENELIGTLKPIIQSDSLWKNTSLDYIKKYYLSKGELNKAKEFETSISK